MDSDTATAQKQADILSPQSENAEKGQMSPLTGAYLLIVLSEPHSAEDRDKIIRRLTKGLLCWDVESSHVDLNCELLNLTNSPPEGDVAKNGEKLIQWASENLVVEVLYHAQVNTLIQCVKNLLSSFTRYRHIIHAGYSYQGSGSWLLQDGTFSIADFTELWDEPEVYRLLPAYKSDITVSLQCAHDNGWSDTRFKKEPFSKLCQLSINGPEKLANVHNAGLGAFSEYLSTLITPSPLKEILQPSEIVGNIRFSHPTLYIFPGGQGDAALFGVNGFNMLIDGGYSRKACFWDFTRHLDRLDAVLLTRVNNNDMGGIGALLERKNASQVFPQIGHFFGNVLEKKGGSSGSEEGESKEDKDACAGSNDDLVLSLTELGYEMYENLRGISMKPHFCSRENLIEPINLYHKVGHGKLDMYILNPVKDSKELKEFLSKWKSENGKHFASATMALRPGAAGSRNSTPETPFPVLNLVSICALLVWQPANPHSPITRILFPGSTPQQKIFDSLSKLKHLEFLRHPVCSGKTLAAAHKSTVKSEKIITEVKRELKSKEGSYSYTTIESKVIKSVPKETKTGQNKKQQLLGSGGRSETNSTASVATTGDGGAIKGDDVIKKEPIRKEKTKTVSKVISTTTTSTLDNKMRESRLSKFLATSKTPAPVTTRVSKAPVTKKAEEKGELKEKAEVKVKAEEKEKVEGKSEPSPSSPKKDLNGIDKPVSEKPAAAPVPKYGIGKSLATKTAATESKTVTSSPKQSKEDSNRKVIRGVAAAAPKEAEKPKSTAPSKEATAKPEAEKTKVTSVTKESKPVAARAVPKAAEKPKPASAAKPAPAKKPNEEKPVSKIRPGSAKPPSSKPTASKPETGKNGTAGIKTIAAGAVVGAAAVAAGVAVGEKPKDSSKLADVEEKASEETNGSAKSPNSSDETSVSPNSIIQVDSALDKTTEEAPVGQVQISEIESSGPVSLDEADSTVEYTTETPSPTNTETTDGETPKANIYLSGDVPEDDEEEDEYLVVEKSLGDESSFEPEEERRYENGRGSSALDLEGDQPQFSSLPAFPTVSTSEDETEEIKIPETKTKMEEISEKSPEKSESEVTKREEDKEESKLDLGTEIEKATEIAETESKISSKIEKEAELLEKEVVEETIISEKKSSTQMAVPLPPDEPPASQLELSKSGEFEMSEGKEDELEDSLEVRDRDEIESENLPESLEYDNEPSDIYGIQEAGESAEKVELAGAKTKPSDSDLYSAPSEIAKEPQQTEETEEEVRRPSVPGDSHPQIPASIEPKAQAVELRPTEEKEETEDRVPLDAEAQPPLVPDDESRINEDKLAKAEKEEEKLEDLKEKVVKAKEETEREVQSVEVTREKEVFDAESSEKHKEPIVALPLQEIASKVDSVENETAEAPNEKEAEKVETVEKMDDENEIVGKEAAVSSETEEPEVNVEKIDVVQEKPEKVELVELKLTEVKVVQQKTEEIEPVEQKMAKVERVEAESEKSTPYTESPKADTTDDKSQTLGVSDKESEKLIAAEEKLEELEAAEQKSEKVEPSKEKPAEIQPDEEKPAKVKTEEEKPVKVQLEEDEPVKVQQEEGKLGKVQTEEEKPAKVQPEEDKPAKVQPEEDKPAKVQPEEDKQAKDESVTKTTEAAEPKDELPKKTQEKLEPVEEITQAKTITPVEQLPEKVEPQKDLHLAIDAFDEKFGTEESLAPSSISLSEQVGAQSVDQIAEMSSSGLNLKEKAPTPEPKLEELVDTKAKEVLPPAEKFEPIQPGKLDDFTEREVLKSPSAMEQNEIQVSTDFDEVDPEVLKSLEQALIEEAQMSVLTATPLAAPLQHEEPEVDAKGRYIEKPVVSKKVTLTYDDTVVMEAELEQEIIETETFAAPPTPESAASPKAKDSEKLETSAEFEQQVVSKEVVSEIAKSLTQAEKEETPQTTLTEPKLSPENISSTIAAAELSPEPIERAVDAADSEKAIKSAEVESVPTALKVKDIDVARKESEEVDEDEAAVASAGAEKKIEAKEIKDAQATTVTEPSAESVKSQAPEVLESNAPLPASQEDKQEKPKTDQHTEVTSFLPTSNKSPEILKDEPAVSLSEKTEPDTVAISVPEKVKEELEKEKVEEPQVGFASSEKLQEVRESPDSSRLEKVLEEKVSESVSGKSLGDLDVVKQQEDATLVSQSPELSTLPEAGHAEEKQIGKGDFPAGGIEIEGADEPIRAADLESLEFKAEQQMKALLEMDLALPELITSKMESFVGLPKAEKEEDKPEKIEAVVDDKAATQKETKKDLEKEMEQTEKAEKDLEQELFEKAEKILEKEGKKAEEISEKVLEKVEEIFEPAEKEKKIVEKEVKPVEISNKDNSLEKEKKLEKILEKEVFEKAGKVLEEALPSVDKTEETLLEKVDHKAEEKIESKDKSVVELNQKTKVGVPEESRHEATEFPETKEEQGVEPVTKDDKIHLQETVAEAGGKETPDVKLDYASTLSSAPVTKHKEDEPPVAHPIESQLSPVKAASHSPEQMLPLDEHLPPSPGTNEQSKQTAAHEKVDQQEEHDSAGDVPVAKQPLPGRTPRTPDEVAELPSFYESPPTAGIQRGDEESTDDEHGIENIGIPFPSSAPHSPITKSQELQQLGETEKELSPKDEITKTEFDQKEQLTEKSQKVAESPLKSEKLDEMEKTAQKESPEKTVEPSGALVKSDKENVEKIGESLAVVAQGMNEQAEERGDLKEKASESTTKSAKVGESSEKVEDRSHIGVGPKVGEIEPTEIMVCPNICSEVEQQTASTEPKSPPGTTSKTDHDIPSITGSSEKAVVIPGPLAKESDSSASEKGHGEVKVPTPSSHELMLKHLDKEDADDLLNVIEEENEVMSPLQVKTPNTSVVITPSTPPVIRDAQHGPTEFLEKMTSEDEPKNIEQKDDLPLSKDVSYDLAKGDDAQDNVVETGGKKKKDDVEEDKRDEKAISSDKSMAGDEREEFGAKAEPQKLFSEESESMDPLKDSVSRESSIVVETTRKLDSTETLTLSTGTDETETELLKRSSDDSSVSSSAITVISQIIEKAEAEVKGHELEKEAEPIPSAQEEKKTKFYVGDSDERHPSEDKSEEDEGLLEHENMEPEEEEQDVGDLTFIGSAVKTGLLTAVTTLSASIIRQQPEVENVEPFTSSRDASPVRATTSPTKDESKSADEKKPISDKPGVASPEKTEVLSSSPPLSTPVEKQDSDRRGSTRSSIGSEFGLDERLQFPGDTSPGHGQKEAAKPESPIPVSKSPEVGKAASPEPERIASKTEAVPVAVSPAIKESEHPIFEKVKMPSSSEKAILEKVKTPPPMEAPIFEKVKIPSTSEEPDFEKVKTPHPTEAPIFEKVKIPSTSEEPVLEKVKMPSEPKEPVFEKGKTQPPTEFPIFEKVKLPSTSEEPIFEKVKMAPTAQPPISSYTTESESKEVHPIDSAESIMEPIFEKTTVTHEVKSESGLASVATFEKVKEIMLSTVESMASALDSFEPQIVTDTRPRMESESSIEEPIFEKMQIKPREATPFDQDSSKPGPAEVDSGHLKSDLGAIVETHKSVGGVCADKSLEHFPSTDLSQNEAISPPPALVGTAEQTVTEIIATALDMEDKIYEPLEPSRSDHISTTTAETTTTKVETQTFSTVEDKAKETTTKGSDGHFVTEHETLRQNLSQFTSEIVSEAQNVLVTREVSATSTTKLESTSPEKSKHGITEQIFPEESDLGKSEQIQPPEEADLEKFDESKYLGSGELKLESERVRTVSSSSVESSQSQSSQKSQEKGGKQEVEGQAEPGQSIGDLDIPESPGVKRGSITSSRRFSSMDTPETHHHAATGQRRGSEIVGIPHLTPTLEHEKIHSTELIETVEPCGVDEREVTSQKARKILGLDEKESPAPFSNFPPPLSDDHQSTSSYESSHQYETFIMGSGESDLIGSKTQFQISGQGPLEQSESGPESSEFSDSQPFSLAYFSQTEATPISGHNELPTEFEKSKSPLSFPDFSTDKDFAGQPVESEWKVTKTVTTTTKVGDEPAETKTVVTSGDASGPSSLEFFSKLPGTVVTTKTVTTKIGDEPAETVITETGSSGISSLESFSQMSEAFSKLPGSVVMTTKTITTKVGDEPAKTETIITGGGNAGQPSFTSSEIPEMFSKLAGSGLFSTKDEDKSTEKIGTLIKDGTDAKSEAFSQFQETISQQSGTVTETVTTTTKVGDEPVETKTVLTRSSGLPSFEEFSQLPGKTEIFTMRSDGSSGLEPFSQLPEGFKPIPGGTVITETKTITTQGGTEAGKTETFTIRSDGSGTSGLEGFSQIPEGFKLIPGGTVVTETRTFTSQGGSEPAETKTFVTMSDAGAMPSLEAFSNLPEGFSKLSGTFVIESKTTTTTTTKVGDDASESKSSTVVTSGGLGSSQASATSTGTSSQKPGTSDSASALPAEDEDILKKWGKPLGLPGIPPDDVTLEKESAVDGRLTPRKDGRSSGKTPSTPKSGSQAGGKGKPKARSVSKGKNLKPIYVDLAYVPHHGNSNYSDSEFFRLIRSRYYVFSGLEPSREVFDGLLQGKQEWEDKNLEVTIVPTYDTDTLGYWVVDSEVALAEGRIDLAPSASRCTINLQDHETSCSAYRLEF